VLSRIIGPFAQTGPNTFVVSFGRAEYTANKRNNDLWILASHPGDQHYNSIVQQARMHIPPNTERADQQITFPKIPDQKGGAATLKLNATSDAGAKVEYYVREGPGDVEGDTLKFSLIPPRAKYPVKVTVVAWQWGHSAELDLSNGESARLEAIRRWSWRGESHLRVSHDEQLGRILDIILFDDGVFVDFDYFVMKNIVSP